MKRTILLTIIATLTLTTLFGMPVLAQDEPEEQRDADHYITSVPTINTARGIGLAITFPISSLPAPASTSTLFFDLFFQGSLSEHLIHRTDVRFYLDFLSGFRFDLTSVRQSILVAFTGPTVVFAVGGGIGLFPIQGVPSGTADGFLLSLHAKTNLEIRVGFVGLFLDFTYEPMPQPFADIVAAGSLVTSSSQFSIGAVFHF